MDSSATRVLCQIEGSHYDVEIDKAFDVVAIIEDAAVGRISAVLTFEEWDAIVKAVANARKAGAR
jgi:hypothetical protein